MTAGINLNSAVNFHQKARTLTWRKWRGRDGRSEELKEGGRKRRILGAQGSKSERKRKYVYRIQNI